MNITIKIKNILNDKNYQASSLKFRQIISRELIQISIIVNILNQPNPIFVKE